MNTCQAEGLPDLLLVRREPQASDYPQVVPRLFFDIEAHLEAGVHRLPENLVAIAQVFLQGNYGLHADGYHRRCVVPTALS